jgi:hypothetical protein
MRRFNKYSDEERELQSTLLSRRYPMPQGGAEPDKWTQTVRSVFTRTWADSTGASIAEALYNLLIGLVLGYGFLVNWLIVRFVPHGALARINGLAFLAGYFVSCFLGVYLFGASRRPGVSFIG